MTKRFTKRVIQPGKYKLADGSEVDITADRISSWNDKHQKLRAAGYHVPIPMGHVDAETPTKDPLARHVDKSWIGGDGWLTMEFVAESDDDALAIEAVDDVSLASYNSMEGSDIEDFIGHVALTKKPVVKSQGSLLKNTPQIALSLDRTMAIAMADENDVDPDANANRQAKTHGNVLDKLAKLGLELPGDTDQSNIMERLDVALTALLSQKKVREGDVDNPPSGSKTQKPSPIAMSAELKFALEQMNAAGLVDDDGKPFTEESIKVKVAASGPPRLQLSKGDAAALKFACDTQAQRYKSRIEACVNEGRISPAIAQARGQQLLDSLEIRFSEDGKPARQLIDDIVETWEAIPAGSFMTGQSPTAYGKAIKTDVGDQFSLGQAPKLKIEVGPPDNELSEVTDADAEKAAEAMLSA